MFVEVNHVFDRQQDGLVVLRKPGAIQSDVGIAPTLNKTHLWERGHLARYKRQRIPHHFESHTLKPPCLTKHFFRMTQHSKRCFCSSTSADLPVRTMTTTRKSGLFLQIGHDDGMIYKLNISY